MKSKIYICAAGFRTGTGDEMKKQNKKQTLNPSIALYNTEHDRIKLLRAVFRWI